MKFAESNKIKNIISPSSTRCKKYNIENKNQKIMENVTSLNNIKLFNDLTNRYLDDEKYISNLKKFAELTFRKKIKKV